MENPNLSHFTTLSIRDCEIDSFIRMYDANVHTWASGRDDDYSMKLIYDLFKESVKCRSQQSK